MDAFGGGGVLCPAFCLPDALCFGASRPAAI
jgi:hypothetical protein